MPRCVNLLTKGVELRCTKLLKKFWRGEASDVQVRKNARIAAPGLSPPLLPLSYTINNHTYSHSHYN